jgi:hypothetical protein
MNLLGLATVVAEPDRPADHQHVGGHDTEEEVRTFIHLPTVLSHVRMDAGGDVVIDRPELIDLDTVLAHDRHAHVDEPLGVARFRRSRQRRIDEQRPQP